MKLNRTVNFIFKGGHIIMSNQKLSNCVLDTLVFYKEAALSVSNTSIPEYTRMCELLYSYLKSVIYSTRIIETTKELVNNYNFEREEIAAHIMIALLRPLKKGKHKGMIALDCIIQEYNTEYIMPVLCRSAQNIVRDLLRIEKAHRCQISLDDDIYSEDTKQWAHPCYATVKSDNDTEEECISLLENEDVVRRAVQLLNEEDLILYINYLDSVKSTGSHSFSCKSFYEEYMRCPQKVVNETKIILKEYLSHDEDYLLCNYQAYCPYKDTRDITVSLQRIKRKLQKNRMMSK